MTVPSLLIRRVEAPYAATDGDPDGYDIVDARAGIAIVDDLPADEARLLASGATYLRACLPELEHDVSPLDWLSAALAEYLDLITRVPTIDGEASFTAYNASATLLTRLRAATAFATSDEAPA